MKIMFGMALGAAMLAGCTKPSDSGPIAIGPNAYTIITQAGFDGTPANTMAMREANSFCSRISRKILLDRFQGSASDAQIYFFCLSPDDSRFATEQHMHSVTGNGYSLPPSVQTQPPPEPQAVTQPPSPPVEVVQAPEPPPPAVHRAKPAAPRLTPDQEFDRAMAKLRQQTPATSSSSN